MLIRSALAAILLFGSSAWAQTTTASDGPQTAEQAAAQRVQIDTLRIQAERRYAEEQNACYRQFLVSDCLAAAKKIHSRTLIEARTLEKGVRDFERAEHRRTVEAKEAARAAELAERDAEQPAQTQHYRAEEARKAAEREHRLADKERQAVEGRKKTEAAQAARQERLAKRAKQDADRAAKKAAQPKITPAD
jgi:hypothetical protein